MSRLPVYSEAPGSGDRVYLDSLGVIRGLRFSTTINGDWAASWQAALDPRLDHRALQPGRQISIPITPSQAWQGTLDTPHADTVWEFTATGTAQLLDRWSAIDSTTANALNLNQVTDEAITRGLNATRGTLPSLPAGSQPSGSLTLAAAYTQVTSGLNQWWNISRTNKITAATLPTTLTYLLKAQDKAGGRTADGFVTDVTVVYLNAATYKPDVLQRSNTAARNKYGRYEQFLDLTPDGPLTTAQAQTRGDNYLTVNAPRLKFTGAFLVARGQLLTPGGTAVDLATVQSGALTQVMLTDPDTAAGELALGPVQIVAGQTEYDVDADQLAYTPLDYSPQGLAALVGSTQSDSGSQASLSYLVNPGAATVEEVVKVSFNTAVGTQDYTQAITFAKTYTSAPGVAPAIESGSGVTAGAGLRLQNVTQTGCGVLVHLAAAAGSITTITLHVTVTQN
jgi:hypothetical protein